MPASPPRIPLLQDLYADYLRGEKASTFLARVKQCYDQAAIERLVESEVASICARTLTNGFNCNNFLCKEAQDFNVKVYIEKETVLIFLSADVPSAII